jgi:hypothetical protein
MHSLRHEAEVAATWVAEYVDGDFFDAAPHLFTATDPALRREVERLCSRPLPLSYGESVEAMSLLILERLTHLGPGGARLKFTFRGREPGELYAPRVECRMRLERGRVQARFEGEGGWSTLHDSSACGRG